MTGWHRGDWFDNTNQIWVDPSPNIRSLNAALLFPGVAMIEYSRNYTVGRGTSAPFEHVGAEFIEGPKLAAYLNGRRVPGVRFYPSAFTPSDSNLKGKPVQGVRFVITNRDELNASRLGLELCAALQKLYPGKIDFQTNWKLIAHPGTIQALAAGEDPKVIADRQTEELEAFLTRRAKYLIYK
jgi:uncharacterized protein YbbC (DUF1343 family)